MGPNIGAKEVLSVDSCRNIGEYSLDIPLNGVLPLLVWCGAFVPALMLFVKLVGLVGPECGVVVALKDAWFEPSCSEEAEYPFKVVEGLLVARFDGVAKKVFASGVSKCDKLPIPFYTLWVDWTDVIVADAFADGPLLVVLAIVLDCWWFDVCRSR